MAVGEKSDIMSEGIFMEIHQRMVEAPPLHLWRDLCNDCSKSLWKWFDEKKDGNNG